MATVTDTDTVEAAVVALVPTMATAMPPVPITAMPHTGHGSRTVASIVHECWVTAAGAEGVSDGAAVDAGSVWRYLVSVETLLGSGSASGLVLAERTQAQVALHRRRVHVHALNAV